MIKFYTLRVEINRIKVHYLYLHVGETIHSGKIGQSAIELIVR